MKHFIDGDQICITKDDFIDLQKSPAVFVSRKSELGQAIQAGGILNMAIGDLYAIHGLLNSGGGEFGSVPIDPEPAALALMVVRHDSDLNVWVIDEDSRHHLEVGNHDVFELQIATIRPLVRDVGIAV